MGSMNEHLKRRFHARLAEAERAGTRADAAANARP